VKTINSLPIRKEEIKSFLDEIRIMCHVGHHQHILSLIGANTSQMRKGRVYAFVDFCELGSLKKVIQGYKSTYVDLFNSKIDVDSKPADTRVVLNHVNSSEDFGANPISSNDLLLWAYQVSLGMEYLVSKKVTDHRCACKNFHLIIRLFKTRYFMETWL